MRSASASLHHALRRMALAVLLLPFVLLTLLPAQVMPVRGSDGLTLTLCTEAGPVDVVIDPATGAPLPAQPDQHERCAWASAQVAVALLSAPPLLPWQAAEMALPRAIVDIHTPRAADLPLHLPRGPPLPA